MNKKYFKKLFLFSKISISTIFFFLLIFGQILTPEVAYAATYNFTQNDWTGDESSNDANHDNNQTGWKEYVDANNINTSQGISLIKNSTFLSKTNESDFEAGVNFQTKIFGVGDSASIKLSKTNFAEPLVIQNKGYSGSAYALKSDGTVWAWGNNGDGQLGNNDTDAHRSPIQVLDSTGLNPLTDIISIAAGDSAAYALKSDGTVWAWGFNGEGRLGDGTTTARRLPVQVKGEGGTGFLTDVTAIYAGYYSAYAIKSDGSVWAWGKNTNGQLSDGTTTDQYTPVRVLNSDGVTPMTGVTEISSGVDGSNAFTYFLKSDGSVLSVGFNSDGELGIGNTTSKTLPVQVLNKEGSAPLSNVISVKAGEAYGLFLLSDGTILSVGYNNLGRLGDGTAGDKYLPVQVLGVGGVGILSDVMTISNTNSSSYALKRDGTVFAWGSNVDGRLGDGTTDSKITPIQVRGVGGVGYLNSVIQISAGANSISVQKLGGTLNSWGKNNVGQLGDNTIISKNLPVNVVWLELANLTLSSVENLDITTSSGSSFILKPDGSVWAWGVNRGRLGLGDGTTSQQNIPVQVLGLNGVGFLNNVKSLSGGNTATYALKNDGTVWSWGSNTAGQLGDGTSTDRTTPVQVVGPGGVSILNNIIEISGGSGGSYDNNDFAVALKSDGTVWAWGANSAGQLGNGNTTPSFTPVQVLGVGGVGYLTDIVDISAGYYMTLALKSDGTVFAWGRNNSGQLGDGTENNSSVPVQVLGPGGVGFLSGISQVEVSLESGTATSSYALSSSGNVYSWGNYFNGRLGRTGVTKYPGLVLGLNGVGYLSNVEKVGAGGGYVLALKLDGTVWAWGKNTEGQIGDGTYTTRDTPVQTFGLGGSGYLNNILKIRAGGAHSLVVKSDGSVYSWGGNTYGELGDGTEITRTTPVNVKNYLPAVSFNIGISSYYSSGNYISPVFDLNKKSELLNVSFLTTPNNQTVSLDMRAGNTATPDGTWSNWLINISNNGSLSSISNNQYIQYRVNLSTSDIKISPEFDSININYNQYAESGDLISSIYDTTDFSNVIGRISWVEENISSEETIKIQVRSSPDSISWSGWCGFENCNGGNYFDVNDNGVLLSPDHPLRNGLDDEYIQYKIILSSAGGKTPTLKSTSLQYVVNARPVFNIDYPTVSGGGVSVVQNDNLSNPDFGKVSISYSAKDIDAQSGSITPNQITPYFEYSIDGGGSWNPIPAEHLANGDVDLKNVSENFYSVYNATWSAKSTAPGVSVNNAKIRVSVNDNEPANNITSVVSSDFILDTKPPEIINHPTLDAGLAGLSQSATITVPLPEDMSEIEYKIFDAPIETNYKDTGWVLMTQEVTIPWTFDSDMESKAVIILFRDKFHNEISPAYYLMTPFPIPASSFIIQDISNVANSAYDVYLGWQKSGEENFLRYNIEEHIYIDGHGFDKVRDVVDPLLSDIETNYYVIRGLSNTNIYKYLLSVEDVNGNKSVRTGDNINIMPDGVQNFGEGGGGIASLSPRVNNIVAVQGEDRNVNISYSIFDDTTDKKMNPSYETYVFYNNDIVLGDDPFLNSSLKLSDASKLKDSGYILINNEVIKYTGKNNNNLTGLVRGTWPNYTSTGRTTRQNNEFYAGTPVWIMANNTSPNSFDYNEYYLNEGEDMTITWDTFNEVGLMGYSYENLGIRVVAHDNNDAMSGPLSTQNDYSEDGLLPLLDLRAPEIYFSITEVATSEGTFIYDAQIELSRSYVFDASVDYAISGTAGLNDHSLASGKVFIPSGSTIASISLPVIDDSLKENSETVIITLVNPENAILGDNDIFVFTIEDNDSFSGLGFSLTNITNTENVTLVNIPVTVDQAGEIDVNISYEISGTATSGQDYNLSNGNIIIPAGETSVNIILSIIDDTLKEESESIIITITNVIGATLNENSVHTYTVTDNDTYPTLGFSKTTSQSREDSNTINVPVSLSSSYPEDVTFTYTVTGGSAEGQGIDYRIEDDEGIIQAGETSFNIPVIIYDDDISEETENIIITISNPTNAVLGQEIIHAFSILDNEILITDINGASVKSTSARVVWTTADYTDSLIEYGIIPANQEGAYNMSKQSLEKVLNHNVYIDELTPETTYYFKTTSTNLAGETTVSSSQFTTTPGPIISGVGSIEEADTSAVITWTTDIPSNSVVLYSTDPSMVNPLSRNISDLVINHEVHLSELLPNEIYYYLVSSTDEGGNTGEGANWGSYYSFSTNDDETSPIISDVSTPIRTNSQVAITWTTNEPADGMVRYGENSGSLNEETELIYSLVTTHLVSISDLEESTQYYYVIESADSNGNKTTTEEFTFETTAKEKEVIYTGGGISGVAQELYDILLAENQAYKSRYSTLNDEEPIVSNIEISDISAFGATISFNTNEDTIAFIKYNKEGSSDQISGSDNWSQRHSVRLTGLSLGTEYSFVVSAIDRSNDTGVSEKNKFTTKYLSENLSELNKIENVEQFQKEIENTIESILPSLVPPFIEKPNITEVTENSAIVNYRTNVKSFPIVSYTEDAKYNKTSENPYDGEISNTTEKTTNHSLKLSGLRPNTLYHFSARAYSLPGVVGKYEDMVFTTKASKIQASIMDIKKDSFNVVWYTDEPTSSIVEYKNTKTGRTAKIVENEKKTAHSLKIENLDPGTTYEVLVSGINNKDNLVESNSVINAKTSIDNNPPAITNLKVDSALVQGRTDRVQTIVSWQTDEPSTTTVYYQEGTGSRDSDLSNKQEDLELTKNHVIILGSLKPGTVYRFTVSSTDDVGNSIKLPVRTIITPKKTESIVDVIFKNFDDTFNFINNVR